MHIILEDLGRKYRQEWIFRGINLRFDASKRYILLGPNGSGKSTLLRVLSGHLSPSLGRIHFFKEENTRIAHEDVYQHIAYTAPYIELIEEMTLLEAIRFHQNFKPYFGHLSENDLLSLLNLPKAADKELRFFSSGMKQRLKLVLAICSDTPILLLDEPSTNLDTQGVAWYMELLNRFVGPDRLCIIASNDPADLAICEEKIHILEYK